MQNQADRILQVFRDNGNSFTLGFMFAQHPTLSYKLTSRFSDLRKRGFQILTEVDHDTPTNNQYRLIEKDCLL